MSVRNISPGTLNEWIASGDVRLIDVRETDEFARTRIDGAVSRPLSRFAADTVARPGDPRIVVYCRTGRRSAVAAAALADAGARDVFNLEGGIAAWQGRGLPVKKNKSAPISLMRQVQIAIGAMVLGSTVLGALLSPWFLVLSGFAGAGLMVAGLTDTCAMAIALSRMPWNRNVACDASPKAVPQS